MSVNKIILFWLLVCFSNALLSQACDTIYLKFNTYTKIPFYYSASDINEAIDSCVYHDDSLFCYILFRDSLERRDNDSVLLSAYVYRYYINKRKYTLFLLNCKFNMFIDKAPSHIVINNTYGIWYFQRSKKQKNMYIFRKFHEL